MDIQTPESFAAHLAAVGPNRASIFREVLRQYGGMIEIIPYLPPSDRDAFATIYRQHEFPDLADIILQKKPRREPLTAFPYFSVEEQSGERADFFMENSMEQYEDIRHRQGVSHPLRVGRVHSALEAIRGVPPAWISAADRDFKITDSWDSDMRYNSWDFFAAEFFPYEPNYNQVVDYAFRTEGDHTSLYLWMTHPRKGVSRTISVTDVREPDLQNVFAFLRDSGERMVTRFKNIPIELNPALDPTKLREGYKGWNPFEDGMMDRSMVVPRFGAKGFLANWSEIIDFYFERYTPSRECDSCEGRGYSPTAKRIKEEIYQQMGKKDSNLLLTTEEQDLLREAGKFPPGALGYDSLAIHMLVEHRTKERNVDTKCVGCAGHGAIATGVERLGLNLWSILPYNKRSRGIFIEEVPESSLPRVYTMLREAGDRMKKRFGRIPHSSAQIPHEQGFPDIAALV